MLMTNIGEGFRYDNAPNLRNSWRAGLAGVDAESVRRYSRSFVALENSLRDATLRAIQLGDVERALWPAIDARRFFIDVMLKTVAGIYYAHPAAWSEIGFGGPASPRGYVRLGFDERDPWEAKGGAMSSRAFAARQQTVARPTCSRRAAGCRCVNMHDDEAGRFRDRRRGRWRRDARLQAGRSRLFGGRAGSGPVLAAARRFRFRRTGAAEAVLARRAHHRRRRPDRARRQQFGPRRRRLDRALQHDLAALSAGMVQVPQPPRLWLRLAAHLRRIWRPITPKSNARSSVAGPVRYPWGPPRRRYPYREHEMNAAGLVLARGAEKLGIAWAATPLATVSAPRGQVAALRVSRLLQFRLLHQRQAERAGCVDPARARSRRRGARHRDGRPHRDRRRRTRERRPLPPRRRWRFQRRATSSSRAMRSKRRACCSTRRARRSRMDWRTAPALSART